MQKKIAPLSTEFFVAFFGSNKATPTLTGKFQGLMAACRDEGLNPDGVVREMDAALRNVTDIDQAMREDPTFDRMIRAGLELHLVPEHVTGFLSLSLLRAVYRRFDAMVKFADDATAFVMSQALFLGHMNSDYRRDMVERARDGYATVRDKSVSEEDIKMVIRTTISRVFNQRSFRRNFSGVIERVTRFGMKPEEVHELFVASIGEIAYLMAIGSLN
ncbi:MAG: hypothetical protein ABIO72_00080 [Patescibacteria group bacterium]